MWPSSSAACCAQPSSPRAQAAAAKSLRRSFWCCTGSGCVDDEFTTSTEQIVGVVSTSGKAAAALSIIGEKNEIGDLMVSPLTKTYDLITDADVDSNATTADTALSISTVSPSGGKPSSSTSAPEDFSGSWTCTKVTGDMEKFLTDMGLNAPLRQAAGAANYGRGRQFQNIAQVGNSFVVQNILKAPVTMRFHAGAGVQTSLDQEGKAIIIEPYWDGNVLCVTSKRESGELIANTRRFMESGSMVLELESPAGTRVLRLFERR